jgi:D-alanyl-D-alanine carboxypeptidase/D-alanyl-D-alanine-endopeptidase (penicillin-binding protein 4)
MKRNRLIQNLLLPCTISLVLGTLGVLVGEAAGAGPAAGVAEGAREGAWGGSGVRGLDAQIRDAANASGLGRSLSYAVVRVSDGATISEGNSSLPFKPASNLKVFTSGEALAELGADFRFRNSIRFDAARGRVTVVGCGDPALGDPEALAENFVIDAAGNVHAGVRADQLVGWWADQVIAAGATRITELVIDARVFDSVCYNPTWPTDQRTRPYCAEVWGFNFHANMMLIGATARSGKVAIDRMEPAFDWTITRNAAQAGPAKSKSTFVVTRNGTSSNLTISGRLPAGERADVDLSVHDAPSLFAQLLARALRARGAEVGTARVATSADPAPAGATVGVIETPIAVVLQRTNTDSANLYAESLLKRLGAARANRGGATEPGPGWIAGSWANGTAALRDSVVERIGSRAEGFVFADGCGLSHSNRVTAGGTAAWLRSIALDRRIAGTFRNSLAVAGESGTVKQRFAPIAASPVRVHCKTGYINGVSALSGLITAPSGEQFAFSVLANGLEKVGTDRAKKAQEAIVTHAVRWLEAHTTAGTQATAEP